MRPPRRVTRPHATLVVALAVVVAQTAWLLAPPASPAVALAPAADHIVVLREGSDLAAKIAKEARLGNAVSDVFTEAVDGFVAELDSADVARLRKDRDVTVVEPDRAIRLDDGTDTTTTVPDTTTSSTTTTTVPDTTTSSTTTTTVPYTTTTVPDTTTTVPAASEIGRAHV